MALPVVALVWWLFLEVANSFLLQSTELLASSSTDVITASCTVGNTILIATRDGRIYNASIDGLALQHVYQLPVVGNDGISYGGLATDGWNTTVVCLVNSSCYWFNNGVATLLEGNHNSLQNHMAIVLNNGSVYTGAFGQQLEFSIDGMVVREVRNDNVHLRINFYGNLRHNFKRDFIAGFASDGFVYFIVRDKRGHHDDVRVLRVCEDANISETSFNAFYEAELKTLPVTSSSTLVNGQLVAMETSVAMVMITLSHGSSSGGIYGIRLESIDSQMNASFDACSSADMSKITIPWLDPHRQETCSQFGDQSDVKRCDFNYMFTGVSALHATINDEARVVLEVDYQITASLFLHYQSLLLCYIAHVNSSETAISKYWISNQTILLTKQIVNDTVYHLDWSSDHNILIASTNTSVYSLPLDDCSNYTTCSSCVSKSQTFCGWCTLESRCSMRGNCHRSNLTGHWIQLADKCPHIDILTTNISVKDVTEVPVSINSTLPILSDNEQYNCLVQNTAENISFTTPFLNGSCHLSPLPSFDGKSLSLSISLTFSFPFVAATQNVFLINCSQLLSCSECIDSQVCGWCTYDMTCQWTPSMCINSSWSIASTSNDEQTVRDICPYLIDTAGYQLPVSLAGQLALVGSNLPSPYNVINGQYICYMSQSNNQLSTPGVYHNSSHITCPFNSLYSLSQAKESVSVHVRWSVQSTGTDYKLEALNNSSTYTTDDLSITFYNCSAFGSFCTTCLVYSTLAAVNCAWCGSSGCSPVDTCQHNPSSITETGNCPGLSIGMITPESGPVAGGTTLTVHAAEMPTDFNDIVSISVGSVQCSLVNTSFIPGSQVSCITGPSQYSGSYDIESVINRTGLLLSSNSTPLQFYYGVPAVYSIAPSWGPVAGGTFVHVSGSFLNNVNSSRTSVMIAGVNCINITITDSSIKCFTGQLSSVRSGSVQVIIDGFVTLSNVSYQYRSNPVCTRLSPGNTIPAGGIVLSFHGSHMTSVSNPLLVIDYNRVSYEQHCTVSSDMLIQCQAPMINASNSFTTLNYMLHLDNIICSRSSSTFMDLILKPDPIFAKVDKLGTRITISGNYFDSVLPNEISVTVQGLTCNIQEVTAESLTCTAPVLTVTGSKLTANVTVTVGNRSLVVGQVDYTVPSEGSPFSLILAVVIASVTLITAIMMLVVAVVAVKYWKMKHPPLKNLTKRTITRPGRARNRNKIFELSLQPSNHYCDVIERLNENGDNIYDTIPDNLYQNQPPHQEEVQYQNQPRSEIQQQPGADNQYQNTDLTNQSSVQLNVPQSLPLRSNTDSAVVRPLSEVVFLSHHQYDTIANTHLSASSPDLSHPAAETGSVLPSSAFVSEGTDSHQKKDEDKGGDLLVPEYAKIIKKLTPIQEDTVYSKLQHEHARPERLKFSQEDYVSMRSASTTTTGPSPQFDFPPLSEYVQMKSAATTPQERPESSYVVMRSSSVSSEPKSPPSYRPKGHKMQRKMSSEDVFLTSSDYIDMQMS